MGIDLNRRRIAAGVVVAFAAAALAVVYSVFDPGAMPFPRCPFLTLTGWQCPGCGSQRAIHALLHGDPAAAWGFNALLVALLPLVAALCVAGVCRRSCPRFYAAVNSRAVILAVAAAVVIWGIVRNLL